MAEGEELGSNLLRVAKSSRAGPGGLEGLRKGALAGNADAAFNKPTESARP